MVYEQADVAALVRTLDYRRRPDRNTRRAMKIAGPIFGVLLIAVAASVIAGTVSIGAFVPATFVSILISAATLLGGVALIRRGDTRGMERRSWKKYPNKGMTVTYTFYDDHFEEEDEASGLSKFQYISIRTANEDEGHFSSSPPTTPATCCGRTASWWAAPKTSCRVHPKKSAVRMDPVEA
ncbi:MAG: hypothetical protein ACLUNZ_03280 [Evtepia sp.]